MDSKDEKWSPFLQTQSGRNVKVSDKAKSLLAQKAERMFWKAVRALERYGEYMERQRSTCMDPNEFKDVLLRWMVLYNETKEAEADLRKFVPPARVREMTPDMEEIHQKIVLVKTNAYKHLDELTFDMQKELASKSKDAPVFDKPFTDGIAPSMVKVDEITQQIRAVEETIENVENELQHMSRLQRGVASIKSPTSGRPTVGDGSETKPLRVSPTSPISLTGATLPALFTMSEPNPVASRRARTDSNNSSLFNADVPTALIPEHSTPNRKKRVRILAKSNSKSDKPVTSPRKRLSPKKLNTPNVRLTAEQRSLNEASRSLFSTVSEHLQITEKEVQEDLMAWAALKAKYRTAEPLLTGVFQDEMPSKLEEYATGLNIPRASYDYIPTVNTPSPLRNPPEYNRVNFTAEQHGLNTQCRLVAQSRPDIPYQRTFPSHEAPGLAQQQPMGIVQSQFGDTGMHGQHQPQQIGQPMYSYTNPPQVDRKVTPEAATPVQPERVSFELQLASVIDKLADKIESMGNKDRSTKKEDKYDTKLPTLEPSIFQGDETEFQLWLNSFVTLVETRITDPIRRLYYLSKYVGGDAKKAIKNLLDLEDDEAYDKAIEKLKERYGSPLIVAESFRKKIRNWPTIKSGDCKALQSYADFMSHCHTATKTISFLNSLSDQEENVRLASKLPEEIRDRWNRRVVRTMHPDSDSESIPTYPTFKDFCSFLSREARIAAGPCAKKKTEEKKVGVHNVSGASSASSGGGPRDSKKFKNKRGKHKSGKSTGPSTGAGDSSSKMSGHNFPQPHVTRPGESPPTSDTSSDCYYCTDKHVLDKCPGFLSISPSERREFCRTNVVCFGCLKKDHDFKTCKHRYNSLLTVLPVSNSSNSNTNLVSNSTLAKEFVPPVSENEVQLNAPPSLFSHAVLSPNKVTHYTSIVPVKVAHSNKPNDTYLVYALIDSQSDGCFCTEDVLETLQVQGVPTVINLCTMGARSREHCYSTEGLMVTGHGCDTVVKLPVCYSRLEIPVNKDAIPKPDILDRWPHLRELKKKLLPYDDSIPVGLLLGYNCSPASFPDEVLKVDASVPWATRTAVGWKIEGPVPDVSQDYPASVFCHKTKVQECSIEAIRRAFDIDFEGVDTDEKVSYDDSVFLRIMEKGFRIASNGHVELPLPVREGASIPKGSRNMAYRRFMVQKKKIFREENKANLDFYIQFFAKMFAQKQAEVAPPVDPNDPFVFYLPHQLVFHPRKPDKPRVVYDGSATVDGVSLNDLLLTGPDLANNLLGVLLRFRDDLVALQCDIQGMFHQVFVSPEWRNMLRFFWFKDNDPTQPVIEYRVTVHLFGAASSPAVATFALRKVAELYETKYGPEVVAFIKRFFYVDDGLISLSDKNKALNLIRDSNEICSLGGFTLHEFGSNHPDVVSSLPIEIRSKELKEWHKGQLLPDAVALGCHWNRQLDFFFYVIKYVTVAMTRRGMLTAIGSLYDPMGLISPVLLTGRLILQKLCNKKLSWDQLVDERVQKEWNEWYLGLRILENLQIRRCYRRNVIDVECSEIHVFCDACDDGYGACGYIVLEDEYCHRDVTLAMGKARVRPLKKTTTPRLELQAAVLGVRMAEFLEAELPPFPNMRVFIWTDSMIVLAYITNTGTRYRIYVANRVQTIRDKTSADQWGHVPTNQNPADVASRGCMAEDLVGNELWFEGPPFLKGRIFADTNVYPLPEDDPEIHREKTALCTRVLCPVSGMSILDQLNKFSSWMKIIKMVVIWRRYINNVREITFNIPHYPVSEVEERRRARAKIVRLVQMESFPVEYAKIIPGYSVNREENALRKRHISSEGRNLKKLDVYLCPEEEILKVGGRLKRAELPEEDIHPIILPHRNEITNKIINYYHVASAHAGRYSTVHLVRCAGWWVTCIRSAVDYVLRNCVDCKRLRGKILTQKMADLPVDRLERVAPFSYCAVDFFGPFYIRIKRSVVKRWACLFTCLLLRSVHLEKCEDMSTDAFLLAYRRFVCRRGPIRSIRCDRGSNLMGAKSDLDLACSGLDNETIKKRMLEDECDWITFVPNTPKSSHMGGVWERMIGSIRRVLEALLVHHGQQLNDDSLNTLFLEAESIVNGRPLTVVDLTDPDMPQAITPSYLLTLKTKSVLPPFHGDFTDQDIYALKTWRRVQLLAEKFWDRWKKEYLITLQERSKWHKTSPNLQPDDVILLVEENVARSCWPLGRVVSVKPSADGLVRSVTVQTKDGRYERPISKIVLLYRP